MTTPNPLEMPSDSRGLIVGQSGTGKTTLARTLLENKTNLLVIDPKHEFYLNQKFEVVTDTDDVAKTANRLFEQDKGKTAIIYRPPIERLEDMEDVNRIFLWAFQRTNTLIYVDELVGVCKGPQTYPYYLKAIYTQGRSKNVGILGATQRPAGIPQFCLSESGYFWKFYLTKESDQERMVEMMGKSVLEPNDKDDAAHESYHTFYYKDIKVRGNAEEYILEDETSIEKVDGKEGKK